MRKIENFSKKGGQLVSIRDSMSTSGSKASWSGETRRFWVKARYSEIDGGRYPGLEDPEEVFLLGDDELDPCPQSGWCYARGFFG